DRARPGNVGQLFVLVLPLPDPVPQQIEKEFLWIVTIGPSRSSTTACVASSRSWSSIRTGGNRRTSSARRSRISSRRAVLITSSSLFFIVRVRAHPAYVPSHQRSRRLRVTFPEFAEKIAALPPPIC